ncbi:neutral zinc metallopeptidase [Lacisediminihabitans sp. H27-G8]|uniref:KPN_02809 family neutral zinc metallopeptidase n=1 Tax=Lacisediminihabitans sp. H27-G8 TaxID=3111909 RepID=UPI0038FCC093
MTFNDNADISSGKASRRGRTGMIAGGGGGVALIVVLYIVSQLTGFDVSGLVGGGGAPSGGSSADSLDQCTTGAQANSDIDCRMKAAAASLEAYWSEEYPALGGTYAAPQPIALFSGSTNTGCGGASSATGPFYCPADETLYIDTSFFADLRDRFGSSGGPLAQLYVVAHEWGHHIQKLDGVLDRPHSDTGPGSTSIRTELQADCFAGAWVGAASKTPDANGVPFLKPPTTAEIADALSAASAVGDDRIQAASGQVNPESWTHGSSEQRQRWFTTGRTSGAESCDTFAPSTARL